ncbi:MAG: hypothetical protein WCA43_01335, partial [Bradyrhizobium sp.]
FVLHCSTRFHELRKVMGTSKPFDSSAAFLFEVPGSNLPLAVQELQIGGTSVPVLTFVQSANRLGLAIREVQLYNAATHAIQGVTYLSATTPAC